jgi:hypothetical protein
MSCVVRIDLSLREMRLDPAAEVINIIHRTSMIYAWLNNIEWPREGNADVNEKLRVCDCCGAFLSIFDSDRSGAPPHTTHSRCDVNTPYLHRYNYIIASELHVICGLMFACVMWGGVGAGVWLITSWASFTRATRYHCNNNTKQHITHNTVPSITITDA